MFTSTKLLSLYGTLPRRDFFISYLFLMLTAFLASTLVHLSTNLSDHPIGAMVGLVLFILSLWGCFAIFIQRIRDTGVSGWFMLVWMLLSIIPFVGLVMQVIWLCIPTGWFNSPKESGIVDKVDTDNTEDVNVT